LTWGRLRWRLQLFLFSRRSGKCQTRGYSRLQNFSILTTTLCAEGRCTRLPRQGCGRPFDPYGILLTAEAYEYHKHNFTCEATVSTRGTIRPHGQLSQLRVSIIRERTFLFCVRTGKRYSRSANPGVIWGRCCARLRSLKLASVTRRWIFAGYGSRGALSYRRSIGPRWHGRSLSRGRS
jgi:hypothetical protein